MVDITINRCTLRIVRHGGWCWGPEPQKLLQGALKALPQLLARELGTYWTDEFDEEIASPIRINVPVRLDELMAVGHEFLSETAFEYSSQFRILGQRINSAVHAALVTQQFPSASTPEPEAHPQRVDEIEPVKAGEQGVVFEVLRSWRKADVLAQRLAVFSLAALESWHASIVSTSDDSNVLTLEEANAVVEETTHYFPLGTETREAILRRRLIILTEVMARLSLSRCPAALLEKLQDILPLDLQESTVKRDAAGSANNVGSVSPASDQTRDSGKPELQVTYQREKRPQFLFESTVSSSDQTETMVGAPVSRATSYATATTGVELPMTRPSLRRLAYQGRHDASALPFLLLGPLSRIGYLKTLAAVLDASNSIDVSPIFATALAYKILAPPARGWRRDPAATASASLFAGLEEAATEPSLVELARAVSAQLSPLEATLSGILIAGHNQGKPLLLLSTKGEGLAGFLLLDVEGVFPIQWAKDIVDLRPALIQLDSSVILIPHAHADTIVLRWLDEEGFRFVTDAPPARSEYWRPLRRPPLGRWWTNDVFTSDSLLAQAAEYMPTALEDAEELWQVLAIERPSIPLADDSVLERQVTMAAAVALGTIAWELWRERESTAPQLALQRFGDLDARVDYSRDAVTVSLPLGKRFLDLQSHGMLDEVNDVPWFNGRKLNFTSA